MSDNITMKASDVVWAGQASCHITIDGKRYNFMQAVNLEAKIEKKKVSVPILGRTGLGHKAVGWEGTGSATFYFSQSILRQLLLDYKDTGADTYFDIQITNEDPTSAVGKQTVVLVDCNIDSSILAKFEAGEDVLEEDMDFTFEDFKMPETFTLLDGML